MKAKTSTAILGVFVIAAVFIVMALILALKGKRLFASNPTYTIMVDKSVKGLSKGAIVTFRGVKIGQVTKIMLMPVNTIMSQDTSSNWPLEITIEIDPQTIDFDRNMLKKLQKNKTSKAIFEASNFYFTDKFLVDRWLEYMVKEHNLAAMIKLSSMLTGQLYIELDFQKDYKATEEELAMLRQGYIPVRATSMEKLVAVLDNKRLTDTIAATLGIFEDAIMSGKVQTMIDDIHASCENLKQISTATQELIDSLNKKIPNVINDADTAITTANTTFGNANDILSDISARIGNTLESVNDLLSEFKEVTKQVKSDVDLSNGPISELIANANKASIQLTELLKTTNSIAQSLQGTDSFDPMEGTALTNLLKEMEEAARSIRVVADMLRDNPEVLLKGK